MHPLSLLSTRLLDCHTLFGIALPAHRNPGRRAARGQGYQQRERVREVRTVLTAALWECQIARSLHA
jgi:hypothetical protein